MLIRGSDSLQRHLARHGEVFKPAPSGRSKRACLACRAGKIKCDGNEICSTCVKKGIECRYHVEDQSTEEANEQQQHNTSNPRQTESMEMDGGSIMAIDSAEVQPPMTTQVPQINEGRKVPEGFKLHGPTGLVDWSTVKVLPDQESNGTGKPDATSAEYLDIYFTYFHHRWPIVHRPSFEAEGENTLVVSSAKMIGAWLLGSFESKAFAITCKSTIQSSQELHCSFSTTTAEGCIY